MASVLIASSEQNTSKIEGALNQERMPANFQLLKAPPFDAQEKRITQLSRTNFPQTITAGGSYCVVHLPMNADIAPNKSKIRFTGVYATGTGTPIAPNLGVLSMINRIVFKSGGKDIFQMKEANLWFNLMYQINSNLFETIGQEAIGVGTRTDRTAWSASPGRTYDVPTSAFFGMLPYYPTETLQGHLRNGFEIWIYWAAPSTCWEESANTITSYTIGNASFEWMAITPNPPLKETIQRNGWNHLLTQYHHSSYTLLAASTSNNLKIEPSKDLVTRIYAIFRPEANVNDFNAYNKLQHYVIDNLTSLRFTLGGRQIHPDEISLSSANIYSYYNEVMKNVSMQQYYFGEHYEGQITFKRFNGSDSSGVYGFLICFDFRRSGEDDQTSGINLSSGNILNMELSSTALSANLRCDIFTEYKSLISIGPSGNILLTDF